MKTIINVLYFTFSGLTTRYEVPRTEIPTSPSEFINRYQLPDEMRVLVLNKGIEAVARYEDFAPQADTVLQVQCVSFEQAMRAIRHRAAHGGVPKAMKDRYGNSYRLKIVDKGVATVERTEAAHELYNNPMIQTPVGEIRKGLYWGTFIEVP